MVPGLQGVSHGLRHQDGPHGQPGPQGLGHGHEVGVHAVSFVRPQGSRATQAALHLVEDEGGAAGIAKLAQPAQELGRGGTHRPLLPAPARR